MLLLLSKDTGSGGHEFRDGFFSNNYAKIMAHQYELTLNDNSHNSLTSIFFFNQVP